MIFAFDGYVLDTALVELRHGSVPIHVEPQVFELLMLLVANRRRVVAKDEILARIWRGRLVSEAALSSRVKAARQAIGDDGSAQRLIQTVTRRGFRFVGEVCEIAGAPPDDAKRARAVAPEDGRPGSELLIHDVTERPAIAVLPLYEARDKAGVQYLGDGITEDIIAALCAWRCFPVISRNTSFHYRRSELTAPELGRAIGARYLLTGSIQRAATRLKLTAALIDAAMDEQLWSGRFVRPLDEIFLLQEELAQQIVGAIEPEIRQAELQRILRKTPADMTAWDLAMRAAWHANRSDAADYDAAEALAMEAASRAPNWHYPYALIAFVRFQRAMRTWQGGNPRHIFAGTLAAARRALAVDSHSWMAHALAGVGELWTHLNHERALEHVHRALELNPSACWTSHFCGCISGFAGDLEAATRHQSRVFRLDPDYPYMAVVEADLALWLMLSGDFGGAYQHVTRALRWDPGYGRALQRLVALEGLRGNEAAAIRTLTRLAELGLPCDRDCLIAAYPFRDPAHQAIFFEGFRRAGLDL